MFSMKTVRYVCTHCGKKFEAEEKETLECPGCFWSTTVKREDEVAAEETAPTAPAPPRRAFKFPVRPFLVTVAVFAGVMALIFLGPRVRSFFQGAADKIQQGIQTKKAESEKNKDSKAQAQRSVPPALNQLTEEEKNILNRRVNLSADRPISEEEQKILSHRAPFQTGLVEKLPSKPWTLENFKQMISEQEALYKVPLPKSYKGKLEKLFKEKYLTGQAAFETGDLAKARDSWVDSLAFPMYSSNIQKHRGVALTMMRSYINDILSKIGAVNGILMERGTREKEQAANQAYEELQALIQKKSWQQASEKAAQIHATLDEIEKPQAQAALPPYPPSVNQIDADIRGTLEQLINASPPAIADLSGMRKDIQAKQRIIDSFNPEKLAQSQAIYQQALDLIAQQNWAGAQAELKKIQNPILLVKDASEKIEILQKLQRAQNVPPRPTGTQQ